MKRVPTDYSEASGDLMSNFDHTVNEPIREEMVANKLYSAYPGLNFFGKVWHESGVWLCEVWVYGNHVQTVEAGTPAELMEEISNIYGHQ